VQEEFEDSKGVIKSVNRTRADNTMAKRKSTKGQNNDLQNIHIKCLYSTNLQSLKSQIWFEILQH
jgi:hypothetical protein